MRMLINAQNISYKIDQKYILKDISLKIFSRQLVTIIGPNGSGKSTLLKILLGLLKPATGDIEKNESLRIGYMPQKLYIDHTLPITVKDFLKLSGQREKIADVLQQVNMLAHQNSMMHVLSGG